MTMRNAIISALILYAMGVSAVQAEDLSRLPGVIAVAESQHRDRWGVDGWHPSLALDGKPDTAWLSDNWEYTHTLAVVFPAPAMVRQVVAEWSDLTQPARCCLGRARPRPRSTSAP